MGGEAFREKVLKFIKTPSDKLEISEVKKIKRAHEIQDIVMGIAGYYGLPEDDLLKRRKRTEGERKIAVYLSRVLSGKRNADIGSAFGVTIQAVTNAVRDVERKREGDERFNSELKRIKEIVEASKQSV